jgi:N-acetylmuramoyl-L-alanine amidase
MEIKQEYIPINTQRRSGQKIEEITYLVMHDTANDGADAQDNVDYYIKSADTMQASAHAFVDHKGVIECVPLDEKAWHVRYNAGIAPNIEGNFANDHAIGVELCYSTTGMFDSKKAYQNYCAYIAGLLQKYRLDTTKLVQHAQLDPTHRTDPINAFSRIGKTWEQFLQDVGAIINSVPQAQVNHMDTTAKIVKVTGVTVTYDAFENGEVLTTGNTVTVNVTPELVAALNLADAGLIEEGYNVEVA